MEEKFVSRVNELRKSLSYDKLGLKVGINGESVRRHCEGLSMPTMRHIYLYCEAFGVSADWLIGLTEDQKNGSVTNSNVQSPSAKLSVNNCSTCQTVAQLNQTVARLTDLLSRVLPNGEAR